MSSSEQSQIESITVQKIEIIYLAAADEFIVRLHTRDCLVFRRVSSSRFVFFLNTYIERGQFRLFLYTRRGQKFTYDLTPQDLDRMRGIIEALNVLHENGCTPEKVVFIFPPDRVLSQDYASDELPEGSTRLFLN